MGVCPVDGTLFEAERRSKRYCSDRCRKQAERETTQGGQAMNRDDFRSVAVFTGFFLAAAVGLLVFIAILNAFTGHPISPVVP